MNYRLSWMRKPGSVDLAWQYDVATGFSYFIVYRDNIEIAQTTSSTYNDQLPDYGVYSYKVTAYYAVDGESAPAAGSIQWGNPHIFVSPMELEQTLAPDSSAVQYLNITNTGELELHYNISTFILSDKGSKDYCTGSGGCDEYISQVEFGDINNTSGCSNYGDYTNLSTSISTGETVTLTISNGNSYQGDICGVWIDWNQNDDFSDDDHITVSGGPDTFTANITAPGSAVGGTTRMRIRMQYFGTPEPCGTTTYGEVEDYSVHVISWLAIDQNSGSIIPSETDQVAVTFDATDLEIGEYYAEFSVTSDDPDLPEVTVPITLIVSEFGVTATASPNEVCLGESVQLNCEVFGGGGNYAYTWTSDPPGFSSLLQSPTVTPTENTTYFVEATDGVNTGTGQVTVSVHELPVVTLGPDTTICNWQVYIFDAGPGYSTYEWQDGSSGQTFVATESGLYWVEVTNGIGCADNDSAMLTVKQAPDQPSKPAGPSFVDMYVGKTSTYLTTEIPEVQGYQWEILPETAGTIINNDHEAIIEWDESFIGEAALKVMATNNCGSSIWSDSLLITVTNTTGIGDLEQNIDINIYPNPNKGAFTLELQTVEAMYVNIYIFNAGNAIVYQLNNLRLTGQYTEKIDLSKLAPGMYSLSIESNRGKVSKQLIFGN